MFETRKHIALLARALRRHNIRLSHNGELVLVQHEDREQRYQLVYTQAETIPGTLPLRYDLLLSSPEKIVAQILSKLHLNRVVYGRQCQVEKIDRQTAARFLDDYHLMNSTSSAYQLGLFFEGNLLAVATFSKGRKMRRLPEYQRSYELIRFCTRSGITVAGGLSKLLRHFAREKKAGDIMTYIDTSTSDGRAYLSAGFKVHSHTAPQTFVVNLEDGRLSPWPSEELNEHTTYLFRNKGNLKLVFRPQY